MKKKIISLLLAGLTGLCVISADFINVSNAERTTVAYAASTKTGTVTATTLNVRSQPNTNGKILGVLKNGTSVTIVDTASNGWYKIKYNSGYGYVSNNYISVKSSNTDISKTRKDIIARAEEMINFTWKTPRAFNVWQGSTVNGSTTFKTNTTYTGMPYTQSGNQMKSGTQFKQKLAASTGNLSTSVDGTRCPLYGNDCSGFVSAAWGISRHTTRSLPDVSRQISYNDLQPGDILNKAGSHVVLFGGWADSGKTRMIILEQTPPKAKKSTKDKSYYTSRGYVARRWNKL